jgi:ABC-2 type transport system permease protein
MIRTLVQKLLRDVRTGLIIVAVLLGLFQCLWARVTDNITIQIVRYLDQNLPGGINLFFDEFFKQGPARIVQTLMGGETIEVTRVMDMLSIAYVHPLTQVILCIWAIGRAAGAIAGEIDRGTMELLLAQPIARSHIILAHLTIDLITVPILCLSMWGGTWLGTWLVGLQENASPLLRADPLRFGPCLLNVAVLVFAISGITMFLSAAGRFRGRVLGLAVVITLVQFLVNVIGQLWDRVEFLRPFTVFYYYQPQPVILDPNWAAQSENWIRPGVLFGVAVAGYGLAWWTFCKRDLPAPL